MKMETLQHRDKKTHSWSAYCNVLQTLKERLPYWSIRTGLKGRRISDPHQLLSRTHRSLAPQRKKIFDITACHSYRKHQKQTHFTGFLL